MQAVKRVLFLAPHLSTGGMPQFLLKRIQALKQYTNYEIFVFEFRRYATQFIVQREQIRKLIPHSNFFTCGSICALIDKYLNGSIISAFNISDCIYFIKIFVDLW